MTTLQSLPPSRDPVLAFARQEWEQLSRTYGHLWGSLTRTSNIYIGLWEEIAAAGLSPLLEQSMPLQTPKKDSYWIEVSPDTIIISGESAHSTLYAVYDAFKRYAGVNWIYPGEPASLIDIPHSITDTQEAGPLFEPWFERRGFVIENLYDPPYILDMIDWLAKNRVNEIFFTFTLWDRIKEEAAPEIVKRGLSLTLGGHSMKFFLDKKEAESLQAADHPYTAKQQLDYADVSWQEPVCDLIAAYCADVPNLSRVSLWPEDLPAEQQGDFLPKYIRFTALLKDRLRPALPELTVEHIAYNAGLAWDMLERRGEPASGQVDTLYAFWGRDYRSSLNHSPNAADIRAIRSLTDWTPAVHEKQRKLSVFEYYSDHFMFSALFPSMPARIVEDAAYYRSLGVDGLTNLIVPCPGYPDYPWKWATGLNSYAFSRAAWGDCLESILRDYYSYYPEDGREAVRQWMETVEQAVTAVTAWNTVLFPYRIVDADKIPDKEEHRSDVISLLGSIHEQLTAALEQAPPSAAHGPAALYLKHLIAQAEVCRKAWAS
ncbi:hypothetical protein [Paenibacillus lutrae]|uniref:Alpha glucuronidase N-terminal domain-containing protein n=1 Tax=Paenibacillus lutrae TaxID=2078573 RepID=A0A7X3FJF1_9BACL|nr:hypothetical protein [Paenibacillus lutrae]MVP00604.1 hypothetical protein [Paenibacillus lutrae]